MYFCTSYVAQVLYCPEQAPMGIVAQARNIMGGHLHEESVWMFQLSLSKCLPPTSGSKVTSYRRDQQHCFARALFLCQHVVHQHEIYKMVLC